MPEANEVMNGLIGGLRSAKDLDTQELVLICPHIEKAKGEWHGPVIEVELDALVVAEFTRGKSEELKNEWAGKIKMCKICSTKIQALLEDLGFSDAIDLGE